MRECRILCLVAVVFSFTAFNCNEKVCPATPDQKWAWQTAETNYTNCLLKALASAEVGGVLACECEYALSMNEASGCDAGTDYPFGDLFFIEKNEGEKCMSVRPEDIYDYWSIMDMDPCGSICYE